LIATECRRDLSSGTKANRCRFFISSGGIFLTKGHGLEKNVICFMQSRYKFWFQISWLHFNIANKKTVGLAFYYLHFYRGYEDREKGKQDISRRERREGKGKEGKATQ
jgi:hypothetical protein